MRWAPWERRHPCLPLPRTGYFLPARGKAGRDACAPRSSNKRDGIMANQAQGIRERKTFELFQPPKRVLLGPGPSPVEDRVLEAMAAPVLGHLDPLFLRCMDDIQEMLRYVFETDNRVTVPISATGSAGMEAALVNIIEPGDEIVVCIHGVFGERMLDIIERAGGRPVVVEAKWGE